MGEETQGATGTATDAAQAVVDAAQELAEKAIDVGEDTAKEVLTAIVDGQQTLVDVQRGLLDRLF